MLRGTALVGCHWLRPPLRLDRCRRFITTTPAATITTRNFHVFKSLPLLVGTGGCLVGLFVADYHRRVAAEGRRDLSTGGQIGRQQVDGWVSGTRLETDLRQSLCDLTGQYPGVVVVAAPPGFGLSSTARLVATDAVAAGSVRAAHVFTYPSPSAYAEPRPLLEHLADWLGGTGPVLDRLAPQPTGTGSREPPPLLLVLDQLERVPPALVADLQRTLETLGSLSVNTRRFVVWVLCSSADTTVAEGALVGSSTKVRELDRCAHWRWTAAQLRQLIGRPSVAFESWATAAGVGACRRQLATASGVGCDDHLPWWLTEAECASGQARATATAERTLLHVAAWPRRAHVLRCLQWDELKRQRRLAAAAKPPPLLRDR
jgi:hypothetical protein